MDVSKLFEPSEIRRLSKDETIALYKRHMMAQYERAEAAEAEVQRLTEGLREIAERCESEAYADEESCVFASQKARALLAGADEPDGGGAK